MRVLAIDVGLTKCGVCILNHYDTIWEIEFWENLNLTRVPYDTETLKKFYYPHKEQQVIDIDQEEQQQQQQQNKEEKNQNFLISEQSLPEHLTVKNSNLLKIGDKIELIYQNLKSFAPLWLLQSKLPIDLIVIEDQNSKFSTHLDEYQYIFYTFFKVYCDLNNIKIKIKFQGGFCKNKIQKLDHATIEKHIQALIPLKRKLSDTLENVTEKAKTKLFEEYVISISVRCNVYLVLKKLPERKQKIKKSDPNDNHDEELEEEEKNIGGTNQLIGPYNKLVKNYNSNDKLLGSYDKAKRLKNKIDVVFNTNYMLNCNMYKNNRYITWYNNLSDVNKRDPADALHHAIYAILMDKEDK